MRPMSAILRLARFSRASFAGTVVYAAIDYCLVPIALGLATRAFFDAVTGTSDGLDVWSAIALIVTIQLFSDVVINFWSSYVIATMQFRSQVLMQTNLFAGILRGFGRFGLRESPADAVSRFRDDPQEIVHGALDALCDLIGRGIFALVAVVLMWRINPTMTMVLFIPVVITSWLAELLGARVRAYQATSREATGRLTAFLGELVAAQLAVKVAGAAPHAVRRLEELGDTRRRVSVRNSVFREALSSVSFNLVHFGTGLVLLIGANDIRNGDFTVGDFAMFVVFLDQLTWLPEEIARMIGELKRVTVSIDRMQALMPGEHPSKVVEPAAIYLRGDLPQLPALPQRDRLETLEVRGLTYAHPASGQGIFNVSLDIERGSFTAITGRIGAGKTTLLHALLGLLPRDDGQILWNGVEVEDPSTFFVPPRSAFTPQVPRLFSETLKDNILLGKQTQDAALEAAIHAAVLEPDVASFEHGIDTLVGPRGVKLSGGQIQRTAAARMFVHDAELLVFDDISSALDAETESELWRRLFERGRDATCIVVSHRPTALRRADRVLVIDSGRVA